MEISASQYINIVSVVVILMLIVVTIFQILYTRSLMTKVSKRPPPTSCSENDNSNTIQVYIIEIDKKNTILWNEKEASNIEISKLKSSYTLRNSRYVTYYPYSCTKQDSSITRTSLKTEFNNPVYIVFEGSKKFVDVMLHSQFDYMIMNGTLYHVKFDKQWNSVNSRSHPSATHRNLFVMSLFKVNPDTNSDTIQQIESPDTEITACTRELITTFTTSNSEQSINQFLSNHASSKSVLVQAMCIPSTSS